MSSLVGVSLDVSPVSKSGGASAWPPSTKVRSSLGVISALARPEARLEMSSVVPRPEADPELSSEDMDCEWALVGVRYPAAALLQPAELETLARFFIPEAYAECAAAKTRSRSDALNQRRGERGSGGVDGVSFVLELKDEEGVSGGVRSMGGRRKCSEGSFLGVGEDDGEDAKSSGRR